MDSLVRLMGSPDMCSRRWVWEQYDNSVMADSVQRPGGDAAVVRVHGTDKALAITTDVTPRYCRADPFEGAKQAVAEAWRNLSAVGATPLAVTDNLNFGNPEKPEIMGEIASAVDGIGDACRALDFPVVSGNCSLYNETNGEAILPTPAIGAVGLLKNVRRMATVAFKREGDTILLIGETKGHLGQSIYLREIEGREEGAAPPVDLAAERRNGDFVRMLIEAGRVDTVHDLFGRRPHRRAGRDGAAGPHRCQDCALVRRGRNSVSLWRGPGALSCGGSKQRCRAHPGRCESGRRSRGFAWDHRRR